jgi:hypothetical protein
VIISHHRTCECEGILSCSQSYLLFCCVVICSVVSVELFSRTVLCCSASLFSISCVHPIQF